MVSKALALRSNSTIQPTKEALFGVESLEELVDGAIFSLKRDIEQIPDFFALIFEPWCTGRRSVRIKQEFNAGINQRKVDIKDVLEDAANRRLIRLEDQVQLEGLAPIILGYIMGFHFSSSIILTSALTTRYGSFSKNASSRAVIAAVQISLLFHSTMPIE